MPLYDFRCDGCAAEREVPVPLRAADDLTLICTACGGTMRRALTKAPGLVITASPSPAAEALAGNRKHGAFGAKTCEDHAVRLTRPNPFATDRPGGGAA
jgi:putative FmdB family regulatory protein